MGELDDDRLDRLADDLRALHARERDATRAAYGRINPFAEDLFAWRERGAYWAGEDRGITIYNSTTVAGDVTIGDHTWIGPFCSLDGTGGLTIGAHCAISLGCQLMTHDTVRRALSGGRAEAERAPVVIGDCCFLGTHVTVLRGVTIGDHCVIGAGAVVTRDVPPRTIAVGVPARPAGTVEVGADGAVALRWAGAPA
jgi:acetyltransferase-like isoleucine patch superfamily enzyme